MTGKEIVVPTELQRERIDAVFDLTKPSDPRRADLYYNSLSFVLATQDEDIYPVRPEYEVLNDLMEPNRVLFHYATFTRPKKSGGERRIYFADGDTRVVQRQLSRWIRTNFELGDDWCYVGRRNGLEAIEVHRRSREALVFDYKNAYEHVSAPQLEEIMTKQMPAVSPDTLSYIINRLLTVSGRLRQGLASSSYTYNVVTPPLDMAIRDLLPRFGVRRFTRYSDNCCASGERIDFNGLEGAVRLAVEAHGFSLSWARRFRGVPIEYLGTRIEKGNVDLSEEKLETYTVKLLEALASPYPALEKNSVTGAFTWSRRVYGDRFPEALFDLFYRYYQKVSRPPQEFIMLAARRHTDRMV
jgi:hypothetical protein